MKRLFRVRASYTIVVCGLLLSQSIAMTYAGNGQFGQKKSLVLFSFAIPSTGEAEESGLTAQYARDLLELINEGLASNKNLSVIKFDPRMASIQRAVREQKSDEKEVSTPTDTTPAGLSKAQKLAAMMGAELAVIGSIDRYVAAKDEASLTATLQLVDVANGKVMMGFTAFGRAALPGQTEEALGTAATYNLAEKLLADMSKEINTSLAPLAKSGPIPVGQPSSSKKNRGLIPAMIGAAILGFLISGG